MKSDYLKQANDFLSKTDTELKCSFLKNDFHFAGDKERRDIYKITLKRGDRKFSFNFGQSIFNSRSRTAPNAYDVLACLTKYDPFDFECFCGDFGYDTDSRSAKKIYKAVQKEWAMVQALWNDNEIDKLSEIQ